MDTLGIIGTSVLGTAALLGIAGWLLRNVIATRLNYSVRNEFDIKLEMLKSDLKVKEEVFKADLKATEVEIAHLRTGAMSALSSRQIAVDKRRLEAVDQLWEAFISLVPAKAVASSMSVVNFEAAVKRTPTEPKLRQFFEITLQGYEKTEVNTALAEKAHPFVPPMAWAYFLAYRAIVMAAVAKAQILKIGVEGTNLLDKTYLPKLLKAALPEQSAFIDQGGHDGFYCLLEELEQKLLAELLIPLTDTEAYKKNVEQAMEITKLSSALLDSANRKSMDQAQPADPHN